MKNTDKNEIKIEQQIDIETERIKKNQEKLARKQQKVAKKIEKKQAKLAETVNYSSSEVQDWDTLDNTAHLFPIVAQEHMTNVYRMSITLYEDVDPTSLQLALEQVLPWFKIFHSTLKKGFFWFYFEENTKKFPQIHEEEDVPCRYFAPNSNKDYMFRVSHYKNRVNLEVFHVLADGAGSIYFFRELIYHYLRIKHPKLNEYGTGLSSETSLNTEDSYTKNYRNYTMHGYNTPNAYIIEGEHLKNHQMGLMHAYMNINEVKKVAKSYEATLNEYLVSVYAYGIYKECITSVPSKPITIAVPVDLRPYYNSTTTKNFFVMVRGTFKPEHLEHTFEDVLSQIKSTLREQINKDNLERLFSFTVGNEQITILRTIPLFLKSAGIKWYYKRTTTTSTSTITNLGSFKVKPEYEPYIKNFYTFLSRSYCQDIKGSICSYKDTLTFTISTVLKDTYIQKAVFRKLAEDGINVEIETNGVYYE